MAKRLDIELELNQLLLPDRFKDYGPNGLQVEGKPEVSRLVSGVTASLALIEAAAAAGADALLVHHGLFWRGQDGRLTGWLKARVECLMDHRMSLFAYHLPLDAHPELGNNARWGAEMGWRAQSQFGEQNLGCLAPINGDEDSGHSGSSLTVDGLADRVNQVLKRQPVVVHGDGRTLRRVAWCSGGAQSYFESAIAAGADVYLTGEISEPQAHLSRETGVAFLACGHHASERYGAPAVGEFLATTLGVEHRFIDIENPA
jgi:dinuclear metal center YbgI/SA1388 family protein